MLLKKLYVRIWLAVVLAVAVLSLLVGWVWRLTAEPPLRDVVIRNEAGQVIGRGHSRMMMRRWGGGDGGSGPMTPSQNAPDDQMPSPAPGAEEGNGPEYTVRMHNGQSMNMLLPRPPQSPWTRPPFGFVWMLTLVAVAVALATYPIIRKLTRRLEVLQDGVEKWGSGDLSTRVTVAGHDEVAFLATRFNHAAQQVETLVKAHESLLASQKSLLANASHELRSPLARIRMGLELMSGKPSVALKEEVTRNIAELDQLVEEILLASRLDAQEVDLGTIESVDLIGLVAEECARVNAELEVHGSTAEAGQAQSASGASPSAVWVDGVAKLLRRAIRNLLENARRHGAGEIAVTLGRDERQAFIKVCDQGPGVPVALRERIFEPFYRLPGATERDGGVGLGLSLVKSIAIRHGGTVQCEDRPDGGACFVLRLPVLAK